jgi:drug/metabolite transporter (DMT)-like permease
MTAIGPKSRRAEEILKNFRVSVMKMVKGPNSRWWIYAALTLAVFFWGMGFVVARFALRSVPPFELLADTSLLAALFEIFWIAPGGRWRKLRLPPSVFWPVAGLGLATQSILNGFTFLGLNLTNGALIFGFAPVMIAAFAALFLAEPFSASKRWGALAGFAGVALIVTQGKVDGLRISGMMGGNLAVLGAALYWAGFSVATRSLTRRVSGETLTFYLLILGALLPVATFWERHHRIPLVGVSAPALLAIIFFALTTSVVAMNIWNWALERIEASRVGVFSYLEPVFAATVAMLFLGERLTAPTAAGAVLVFGRIFLSTHTQRSA